MSIKMCVKIIYLICFVVLDIASAASVYDQSQTGKLNVQIDLKDLQVIALTKSTKEEYVDYDYAYDYSEMTIKPQNGTTVKPNKPLNVTTTTAADVLSDNATVATTVYAETTTELIKSSTLQPSDTISTTQNAVSSSTLKSIKFKNTKNTTKKSEAAVAIASANNSNCTRGLILCDALQQNKPLSILELLSQRFKRRDHRKESVNKE